MKDLSHFLPSHSHSEEEVNKYCTVAKNVFNTGSQILLDGPEDALKFVVPEAETFKC